MNPSNYRLSKEVLQEMLDQEYRKRTHKFETVYDKNLNAMSPSD